ncbi:glycosyltransferase [Methylocapsa polymorpha]|uniref:Glycosyltransferase n=1 Tax=Methylocapsa polymorpha TaxID=3080828 RepID=A0ABZ0HWP2_9HYPH|nr:glycosyltransferase [Methylocapsa sp. RX1]
MSPAYRTLLSSINALRRRWLIARSRIFDVDWYKTAYPDVGAEGSDPISHYLQEGARQGRRPHLLFDPAWYEAARGSARRDRNPLIDYILYGAAEGVEPSPYFSTPFYSKISGGLGRLTPLGHFAADGSRRGLVPTPLFDRRWYLENNPDVRLAGFDPFLHFVASGAKDGRSPGPLFDAAWYQMKNPDARDEGFEPLHHYIAVGAAEGRNPSPCFDVDFFVASAMDESVTRQTALASYAQGRRAWRSTHPVLPPPASPTAYFEALPWRRPPNKETALEAPFRVVIVDVGKAKEPLSDEIDRQLRILASLPALDIHLVTNAHIESIPDGAAVIELAHPDLSGADHRLLFDRLLRALRFRDPKSLVVEQACAIAPLAEICAELQLRHHDLIASAPPDDADWIDILARKASYRAFRKSSISVIIPNFNHAHYLDQRIGSILEQRLAPDEIIFLDDCSSDDSLARAKAWATKSAIPFTIISNESNSGSTFQQWTKGIERATGDLVWIAESDDCAHPRFLERMAPLLLDPQLTLAYCDSQSIGAEGELLSQSYRFYTDSLSETKWLTAYVNRGDQEIAEALAIKNTIPNVSAVLFRREALVGCVESLKGFRYCGDWWTYVECLRHGDIGFCPQVLNSHRRQVSTGVTQAGERESRGVEEAISIKLSIFATQDCDASMIWTSLAQTVFEYEIRSRSIEEGRPSFAENEDLAPSIEKLASFLAKQGCKYPEDDNTLAAYLRGLAQESTVIERTEREEFVDLVLGQVRAIPAVTA